MFLHQLDLTTALRPSLLPEETLLFVQDAVGLYEGKLKIPQYQNGQAYLTSHRVCYVDHAEPRKNSVAIFLKDVEKPDFYAGFLKSSPKITLYPKPANQLSRGLSAPVAAQTPSSGSPERRNSPAPAPSITASWVCPICSFSNPVPSNFDPALASRTPIPPCLACGIKPPTVHVVKAAIAAISNRPAPGPPPKDSKNSGPAPVLSASGMLSCPRCTFQNHPSLSNCEMCGASLKTAVDKRLDHVTEIRRAESPGPSLTTPIQTTNIECIKLSFRSGGEKIFYERLKNALVQRKWLLQSAPPIPKPRPNSGTFDDNYSPNKSGKTSTEIERPRVVGIAGLERRGLEQRQTNEAMIGNAFEDLEALMTSAKEIIALAEQFASQANLGTNGGSEDSDLVSHSASALGLITTKDMLGSGSESLYVSELSRNLAEWLTDDTRGVLRRGGGIMTLVDLWAMFNRARGGVELVSPADFEKAARMWDTLKLPIRLRKFKSGLLVVQSRDRTDEKTIASLLTWLKRLHVEQPTSDVPWDWKLYGRGITAQETAEKFGWSVGVAIEELEMAEEAGALCREQSLDGFRFWENWLIELPKPVVPDPY